MSKEHKSTFSVHFFIRKDRLDKKGEAPVFMRILCKGVRKEISLHRSVPLTGWNQTRERASSKSREATELNFYLDTVHSKVLDIHRRLEKDQMPIFVDTIVKIYQGKDGSNKKLIEEYEDHNKKCRELIGNGYAKSTCDKFDTSLNHLKTFLKTKYKRDDIFFSEIDYEFISDFSHYLRTTAKMQNNSAVKQLKNLKKLILMAIKKDWIRKDPFIDMPFKYEETHREFLTKNELLIIKNKEFKTERLAKVRDIFLFCCYTGLAFVDAYTLAPKHLVIDNEECLWIVKKREKTGVKCNIPLIDAAVEILEKYKDHPVCIERDCLLPVIRNQKMNEYLKEMADICGINKNLSTHVARHTCATTVMLGHKVSLKNTANILGHKKTSMTERYTHLVQDVIKQDVSVLNSVF